MNVDDMFKNSTSKERTEEYLGLVSTMGFVVMADKKTGEFYRYPLDMLMPKGYSNIIFPKIPEKFKDLPIVRRETLEIIDDETINEQHLRTAFTQPKHRNSKQYKEYKEKVELEYEV